MSDVRTGYVRAMNQLYFSVGHPIGLYVRALEAHVAELKAALDDLLEAVTMAPRLDTEVPIINPHAVSRARAALAAEKGEGHE